MKLLRLFGLECRENGCLNLKWDREANLFLTSAYIMVGFETEPIIHWVIGQGWSLGFRLCLIEG